MARPVLSTVKIPSEGRPLLPLSSRIVRASGGKAGTQLGRMKGDQHHIAEVHGGQRKAGNKRALVHLTHTAPQLVGQDDQHQRRRNDLRQRARGGNHTGWQCAGHSRSAA